MEETVLKYGFNSLEEFNRLVANIDLTTLKKQELFKQWQLKDGSKKGLLKLRDIKLAVIGSRRFENYSRVSNILGGLYKNLNITHIVSGGARGADSLGERWANAHNVPTIILKPDWSIGKSAGFKRNIDIIKECDICIAFWDGLSKGTEHSLKLCKQLNKQYFIVKP